MIGKMLRFAVKKGQTQQVFFRKHQQYQQTPPLASEFVKNLSRIPTLSEKNYLRGLEY